ncbi:helix-turn-helix domain-containing protein [Nocardioides marinus]|nr:helix-turn-helix domain-containing protein [Nocardioides marinus]
MSYSAMQWAFEQTDLNTTTKLILIGLAYHRNDKDYRCYPSQSLLAKEVGVSVSTINKGLRALEQRELISSMRHCHPGHGGSISSSYTFPALDGPHAAARHTPYQRRLTALRPINQ